MMTRLGRHRRTLIRVTRQYGRCQADPFITRSRHNYTHYALLLLVTVITGRMQFLYAITLLLRAQ